MNRNRIRTLLIEDDEGDFKLIERCLARTRALFEVDRAATMQDGLSKLAAGRFDVVLTDLSLPDSDKLETVRAIRERDGSIAIVVLTGLDDVNVERDALTLGAQDYLCKLEATSQTLERTVLHAIHRQQTLKEINDLLAELRSNRQLLVEQKHMLMKKNRRLKKLYRTAHRFVDNVSHEFRTPLTVIKDYVSLVREGLVGTVNDEQCRMLDIASVRVDDLNNMVDDMLDVSKLESGILAVWRRPCRIADIVNSVRPGLMKKAEVKNIVFEIAVDQNLPNLYCDAEKVGRVIINLVTNAMKFCGDPGTVRLTAELNLAQSEIIVRVCDNGQGIADEDIAQIFKRFKQLNTTLKNSTKGFGLGLNIAKELVDLNFGEMHVESQVGRGSTFSFTVPLANRTEVLCRYLKKIQKTRNGTTVVACVRASIDDSVAASAAEELNAFFSCLTRHNDLLLQIDGRSWLFALPIARSELELFLERAKKELAKANRNRPYGPLPDFELDVEGSWRADADAEAIVEHFRQAINPEPVCA